MTPVRLTILFLAACGVFYTLQAAWIPAKAFLAFRLLDSAAEKASESQQPEKPWSWADFGSIGTLEIRGETIPVLDRATGQALAFGAGRHEEFDIRSGPTVISGHRDTHFSVLETVSENEALTYTAFGETQIYKVLSTRIYDIREGILLAPEPDQILLMTCWPFGSLNPDTPKRFLVLAQKVPQTKAAASH